MSPPPIPSISEVRKDPQRPVATLLIIIASVLIAIVGALILLRVFGVIEIYSIRTGSMAPAITAGDCIFDVSYFGKLPRRGDIAAFKTDGIPTLPSGEIFMKRVVGEPGERLRILNEQLYINDKHATLSNAAGPINYAWPSLYAAFSSNFFRVVPPDSFFVIGDNTTNSSDSRIYGSIPRSNIIGRILFRYWPPQKIGFIK